MKTLRLPVAFLLAACIPLASVGCYSGYDYALEGSNKLSIGMTMAEVRERLGNPDLIVRGDEGTETSWFYRYEGGESALGTICTVFMVIFFIVLIVVLVAAASGGGGGWGGIGGGGGGGGGDGPPAQIKLTFDPEGRLVEVSEPHPVPGR